MNAKLREALEALVEVVETWKDHLPSAIRDGELSKALEKADSALSEPPRNCDVGTVEEQDGRFRKYCREHDSTHFCESCTNACRPINCALAWAQMPYK